MAVQVSMKDEKIRRAVELLRDEGKVRKAAARAINRSIDSARAETVRQVPKLYAVKQKQVRDRVTTRRAGADSLSASVTWRGYALNIADFSVRPGRPNPAKRPMLRAMVSRQTGFDPYHGAFLINRGGRQQAFRRRRQNDGRYPITGVWGPSIPQLIGAKSVREAVEERAREQLDARLDHEINRLLDGAR